MSTTQLKLTTLINTKNAIRQKLISLGVDVPQTTPFSDYPDLIKRLNNTETVETTSDQYLLQLLDLYHWLGTAEYEDHTYTDEEIQMIHALLDKINNGETKSEEEPPKLTEPYLMVISGRTIYYPGDIFSLDGYIAKVVYPNGTVKDVTEICTFTPTTPLTTMSEYVTISCTVDDTVFNCTQPIKVHKLLDYIASSGTQYIKTGILPANISRVEVSFMPLYADTTWRSIFHTELKASPWNGMGLRFNTTRQLNFGLGYGVGVNAGNVAIGAKYDVEWYCTEGYAVVNGDTYEMGSAGTMVDTELYMFASNVAGSPSMYGHFRLYYLKFYDLSGNLIKSYIPAKDFNGIICLRDLVNETYVYNNGTGSFIAGNVIDEDHNNNDRIELEYIQSSGTQWIDTGYVFTSTNQKVEFNFTPLVLGDDRVCGSYTNESNGNHCGMIVQPRRTNMVEIGNNSYTPPFSISADTNYDVILEANDGVFTFKLGENTTTGPYTASNVITGLTHYIFNVNYDGNPNPATMKLTYYKMYDDNVLVRDFIPVLDINGIACLFDNVTKTYFYSHGNSLFIAGPEITIEEVE